MKQIDEPTRSLDRERSSLGSVLTSLPWPAAESICAMVSGAVTIFLIARMIGAEAFGQASIALGIVLVMLVGVNSLVHDAIVRLPNLEPEVIDIGFTASLSLAALLMVVGVLAAPWIGMLFEDRRISDLTRALLVLLPLAALSEPLIAVRRRMLDFRTVAKHQIAARMLGAILGLIAAWWQAGAWSLVVQYLSSAVYLAATMVLSTGRFPRLRFSWRRAVPLLTFCSPIIASQLLTQGTTRLILMGVGHWHGIVAAGHWSVATRMAETIFGGLNQAAYNVSFAHFSLQRNDRQKLSAIMSETQAFSMILAVPVLCSLAAVSGPLITLLLGPSWSIVAELMLGPLAASFLLIRRMPPTTALRVVGMPRASLDASIVEAVAVIIGLLLVGQLSLVAVSVIYPLAVLAGYVFISILVARVFKGSVYTQLLSLLRDASIGLGAFLVAKLAVSLALVSSPIPVILITGGVAFFTAATLLLWAESSLVRNMLSRRRFGT